MRTSLFKSAITWNSVLVVSVFLCSFVVPVFPVEWGRLPIRIVFTLVFLSGVLSMEKPKMFMLYVALTSFVMEWVSMILELGIIVDVSRALNVMFFILVIGSLIREMTLSKDVTPKVIMASISGYLLMGIIYSALIVAIVQRDPGAFNFPHDGPKPGDATAYLSESMYFGFVTLGTLGYGDILPLKPYTRSLATLITISGQLYIATVIGILIGKYASKQSREES